MQECIYVANEYPAFIKTMSIENRTFRILRQIILNRRQNCPFSKKNQTNFWDNIQIVHFSTPLCRDSKT